MIHVGICSGRSKRPSFSRRRRWIGSRLVCRSVDKATTCWTFWSIARISTISTSTSTSTWSPSKHWPPRLTVVCYSSAFVMVSLGCKSSPFSYLCQTLCKVTGRWFYFLCLFCVEICLHLLVHCLVNGFSSSLTAQMNDRLRRTSLQWLVCQLMSVVSQLCTVGEYILIIVIWLILRLWKIIGNCCYLIWFKQGVALMGRNTTGPPHAAPLVSYVAPWSFTDDDRCTASETILAP